MAGLFLGKPWKTSDLRLGVKRPAKDNYSNISKLHDYISFLEANVRVCQKTEGIY